MCVCAGACDWHSHLLEISWQHESVLMRSMARANGIVEPPQIVRGMRADDGRRLCPQRRELFPFPSTFECIFVQLIGDRAGCFGGSGYMGGRSDVVLCAVDSFIKIIIDSEKICGRNVERSLPH